MVRSDLSFKTTKAKLVADAEILDDSSGLLTLDFALVKKYKLTNTVNNETDFDETKEKFLLYFDSLIESINLAKEEIKSIKKAEVKPDEANYFG